MIRRKAALLATMTTLSIAGGATATPDASSAPFKVGRTGILCYTQPCPWQGVWPAGEAVQPARLLWSGPTPPPMTGDAAELALVRENYLDGCTLVEARFSDGILAVSQIIGEC